MTGQKLPAGPRLVFDIETDGLLDKMDTVHCIGVIDYDTQAEQLYVGEREISVALARLSSAGLLIGHNIIGFDIPAIQKVYPNWRPPMHLFDTLLMAPVAWPAIRKLDATAVKEGTMPGKLAGSYSLKAFGHRMKAPKDDYAERMTAQGLDPWAEYTDEMGRYCLQDCRVQRELARQVLIRSKIGWPVIDMEQTLKAIIKRMEHVGVWFDHAGAISFLAELQNTQAELETHLIDLFGAFVRPVWEKVEGEKRKRPKVETVGKTRMVKIADHPHVTRRRVSPLTGKELKPYVGPPLCEYTTGSTYCPIDLSTFNPSSRDDIADRLIRIYGWRPTERTKEGKWKVDETTLEGLPASVPAAIKQALIDYFIVSKTIGALYAGAGSWLSSYREKTQRIHGHVDPNGTITYRAAHSKPNLGQVPKVLKDRDKALLMGLAGRFGWECRSLFGARPGWDLVGCDASGLELRMLAHYLGNYDAGRYAEIVVNGDVHEANRVDFELDLRETSKTGIYAMIYGGGDVKLGSIALSEKTLAEQPTEETMRRRGKKMRSAFVKNNPAYGKLDAAVKAAYRERRWLKTVDGRAVRPKGEHSALNAVLQSAGSIVCKLWIVILMERLAEQGLHVGADFELMLWVHDEVQIECRPGLGEIIGKTAVAAIREAGERFKLKCPLDGEYKVARGKEARWAHTH